MAKCVSGGFALVAYATLLVSVRKILESDRVTGRDIARGPLTCMVVVMTYIAFIFVIGVFENPESSHPSD